MTVRKRLRPSLLERLRRLESLGYGSAGMAQPMMPITFQLCHGRVPARTRIKQRFVALKLFNVRHQSVTVQ